MAISIISYEIILTIINYTNNQTETFSKSFNTEKLDGKDINIIESNKLYNNHHSIKKKTKMFNLFKKEINAYCKENGITINQIDIEEFNINSLTDKVDVYFEPGDGDDPNQISLEPDIKCYIYPQYENLEKPILQGKAYDHTTIVWSWAEDGLAHYLVTENIDVADETQQDKIIAQIPIGINIYTETGLEPNTSYTRRLVSYDANRTSSASIPVTIQTEIAPIDLSLESYAIDKLYDFDSNDADRVYIDENLEAFHSGIGDYNDLKVYKQMDSDFHQKFKAYMQIRGVRTAREKCYDTVGFNYKVCMEATEEVEERRGEVTFDLHAAPREKVTIKDYMYSTGSVKVCARLQCDVLAKKEIVNNVPISVPILEPKWEPKMVDNTPTETITETKVKIKYETLHVILVIDVTGSYPNICHKQSIVSCFKQVAKAVWSLLKTIYKKYNDFNKKYNKNAKVYVSLACFMGQYKTAFEQRSLTKPKTTLFKYVKNNKKEEFIKAFASILNTQRDKISRDATCWAKGVQAAHKLMKSKKHTTNKDSDLLFFFSDGGANLTSKNADTGGSIELGEPTHGGALVPHKHWSSGTTQKRKEYLYKKDGSAYSTLRKDLKKAWDNLKDEKEDIEVAYVCVHGKGKTRPSGSPWQIFTEEYQRGMAQVIAGKKKRIITWDKISEVLDDIKKMTNDLLVVEKTTIEHVPEFPYTDENGNGTNDPQHQEGWEFKGWVETDSSRTLNMNADASVDDCKWVKVIVPPLNEDPWTIEIDDNMTPIIYARNENRAIVPRSSFMKDLNFDTPEEQSIMRDSYKLDNRSILQMVQDSFRETNEYLYGGYTQIVEAYTADENRQGHLMIRNVALRDCYKFDDADIYPGVCNPGNRFEDLEDGYDGTLNVYTNIDKMGTADILGDDVYLANDTNYVYLSGYTDAIIYDGDRLASCEINASGLWGSDQEVLISLNGDNYKHLLSNRKNKYITYNGSGYDIRHCAEVRLKDKDIYILDDNGNEHLINEGDWTLYLPQHIYNAKVTGENYSRAIKGSMFPSVKPLTSNLTAHIYEKYDSPILNYRFSLIDPDSKTEYYNILPDADPDSPYQHVVNVRIFYARNIYTKDEKGKCPHSQEIKNIEGRSVVYIKEFGENNIAATSSLYYYGTDPEYPDKNSLKTYTEGQTIFLEDYIDDFLWFQTGKKMERRKYYAEKPEVGRDSLYGSVNGRYGTLNKNGRKDLKERGPFFLIPSTVLPETIKYYVMIEEFYPEDSLVSYRWEHPLNDDYGIKNGITNVNGDYIIFSSDSITYKDVEHVELLETVTSHNIEVYDNKTTTNIFKVQKPNSNYTYDTYQLELVSNNSDVMILNYPKEITFDEFTNEAEFEADCKGVVNATTKWSPRIHNGYYYLNQHEYYAYSEFDVDADFVMDDEDNYKVIRGYLTIDVDLLKPAGQKENYTIAKNTRSELLQNEKNFEWALDKNGDGIGLTLKPIIDGEFYKEFETKTYVSPVFMFPNILTSAGQINILMLWEGDNKFNSRDTLYNNLQVRSYIIDEGKWSEWTDFVNGTAPRTSSCPLSCAYQIKMDLNACVSNEDLQLEDYLCCYLDWLDEQDLFYQNNVISYTDYLQAGPYVSEGIFISRVFDYGTRSKIKMDIFASKNNNVKLYFAVDNKSYDNLAIGSCRWELWNGVEEYIETRFLRYKLVIPYGDKVYWVHKNIITKKSYVDRPIIKEIKMTGEYQPVDKIKSFQEIQSFEITTDGLYHRIVPSLYKLIASDVERINAEEELSSNNSNSSRYDINRIEIKSSNATIDIRPDDERINIVPPPRDALQKGIKAMADYAIDVITAKTPYIYAKKDAIKNLDVIEITRGTPQQYAPIVLEDMDETPYQRVYDVDELLYKKETFEIKTEDDRHFIRLDRNDYDEKTLAIYLNDLEFTNYRLANSLIIFNNLLSIGDKIEVAYRILNSFYADIDYEKDTTKLTLYSNYDKEQAKNTDIMELQAIAEDYTYDKFDVKQLYLTGKKIAFYKNKVFTKSDAWYYNADGEYIELTDNFNEFTALIDYTLPSYQYTFTVNVKSLSEDNDVVGVIIGYIKDSANKEHTLSYLISLTGPQCLSFNNKNTAIVYDYNTPDERIISSKEVPVDNFNWWSDMPEGIKIWISKTTSGISCKISEWNNPEEWNNESQLIASLSSSDELSQFADSVYYGYCGCSQGKTYFTNPSFSGKIDKAITLEKLVSLHNKRKYKVFFETNKTGNKFIAEDLSLNPIYRTDYKGFIYLTDEHNEPYYINIYCNPRYVQAGGNDKVDISIECLDNMENPVINHEIYIDCKEGIFIFDNDKSVQTTDMNGVVHVIYESTIAPCEDTITARTLTSDNKVIENSIIITNE